MEKCLFCDRPPGSIEHVFLSALGGRLATRHATCESCNNDFATERSGKIDDKLANQFIDLRCGLAIWSGRNAPPPTIANAGEFPGGGEFDLAPGFVPVLHAPRVPSHVESGEQVKLVARNVQDVKSIKEIFKARGQTANILDSARILQKAPMIKLSLNFGGEAGIRSASKTAVIGACVLYGNIKANQMVDPRFLELIKYGGEEIFNFAEWDYTNDWPYIDQNLPHRRTPYAIPSGFEHTLIIGDVGENCIAYVEFFGGLRFSARIGSRSGFQPKGFSINPRALRSERFLPVFKMPQSYNGRYRYALRDEFETSSKAVEKAISNVMKKWSEESHSQYYADLTDELQNRLDLVGDDPILRQDIVHKWAEEVAAIELGDSWSAALDLADLDDVPTA